MEEQAQANWVIEVHDSLEMVDNITVPVTMITKAQVEALMKALAARYGEMNASELLGSFVRRGTLRASSLLEVQRDVSVERYHLMCGNNPFVTARVVPWNPSWKLD